METKPNPVPVNGEELLVAMEEILGFLERLVTSSSEAADRLVGVRTAFNALKERPPKGEIDIEVGPPGARTLRREFRPTEGGAVGTKRVSC